MIFKHELDRLNQILDDEIKFQFASDHNQLISSGELISTENNRFIYQFELENEISLTDGVPVVVEVKNIKYEAEILNVDQFFILLAFKENLGKVIEKGFINLDPLFLLKSLKLRLGEIKESPNKLVKELIINGYDSNKNGEIPDKSHIDDFINKNEITFIWGPPGTGKTTELAKQAINFALQDKKILIVSQSNISVDEAILKIEEKCQTSYKELLDNGQVMRYGFIKNNKLINNENCNPRAFVLKKYPVQKARLEEITEILKNPKNTNENILELKEERNEINELLRYEAEQVVLNSKIIATTISKATVDSLIYEFLKFDIVIFDEASMAYVQQIIFAVSLAKERFLCFGDMKQLAPICHNQNPELQKDIYSYLNMVKEDETIYHKWLIILNEQYRFHPDISEFVNNRFYGKRIKNSDTVVNGDRMKAIVNSEPFPGFSISFIDTSDYYATCLKTMDNSRINLFNAAIELKLAIDIANSNNLSVGIITPYAAQARLLRKMLKDYINKKIKISIDCSTVHQFQGSERDVIIFDTVENYPNKNVGLLLKSNENYMVDRLINVAVTRAKGKLILVGNASYWNKRVNANNPAWDLIKYIKRKDETKKIESYELFKMLNKRTHSKIKFYTDEESSELDFFEDLDNAKSITILLPPGDQIDDLFIETLEDLKEDVDIQFYTSNEMNKFADIVIQTKPQFMPLTIINEEIIWYDMPNLYKYYKEGDKTIRPRYELPFRIEGKQTYNLLNQFINIKNNIYINEAAFYSKSLIEFLNTKVCEYCGKPINLYKDKAKHLRVKCSNCTNLDTYLSTQLINEFFKTYNIVCPFDNGKLSARIDNYGMYIHCNEKHNIKIDDFFEFD